jgi:hypothetical protein
MSGYFHSPVGVPQGKEPPVPIYRRMDGPKYQSGGGIPVPNRNRTLFVEQFFQRVY